MIRQTDMPAPFVAFKKSRPPFPWVHLTAATLLFLVFGVLLIVFFHAREQTAIFFWDFSGYWGWSIDLAHVLRNSPPLAVWTVWTSLANPDYSMLPTAPLTPILAIWGDSRGVYLLAVTCIYGLAALLTLMLVSHRVGASLIPGGNRSAAWAPAAVVLGTTIFWTPILRGYPDVGGLPLAFCVLYVYFRAPLQRAGWRTLVSIAILLALLPLFRRWYAYWVVAFFPLALLGALGTAVCERPFHWRNLSRHLRPVLVIAGVTFAVLSVAGGRWLVDAANTDYRAIFAAYRPYHSALEELRFALSDVGYVYAAVVLVALIALIADKRTRPAAAWLTVHSFFVWYMFQATQHFSAQHYYLFQPAVLLLLALFVIRIATQLQPKLLRIACLIALATVGAMLHLCVFWPEAAPLAARAGRLCPAQTYPLRRGDTAEMARLLRVLDGELNHTRGALYVLSSSGILTEDILRNATRRPPGLAFAHVDRLARTAHVDERDGFPAGLLTAGVVVLASPVQFHLPPEHQHVVSIPAESILTGRDIGGAFERLPEQFTLDGAVAVSVYRKVRPISNDELNALSSRLRAVHPDSPAVFRIPKNVAGGG